MSDGVKFIFGYITATLVVGLIYMTSNTQRGVHDVKMADGQPADEFILASAMKFFDAGCVDALERMKQVDPERNKGNPESYCGPRTIQVGKEIAIRMKAGK